MVEGSSTPATGAAAAPTPERFAGSPWSAAAMVRLYRACGLTCLVCGASCTLCLGTVSLVNYLSEGLGAGLSAGLVTAVLSLPLLLIGAGLVLDAPGIVERRQARWQARQARARRQAEQRQHRLEQQAQHADPATAGRARYQLAAQRLAQLLRTHPHLGARYLAGHPDLSGPRHVRLCCTPTRLMVLDAGRGATAPLLTLAWGRNSPATIDADYRGEIIIALINLGQETFTVEHGMRVAQIVVAPVVRAVWELSYAASAITCSGCNPAS